MTEVSSHSQGRCIIIITRVDICSTFNEQPHHTQVPTTSSIHECGSARAIVTLIDICITIEQKTNRLNLSCVSSSMQRIPRAGVGISTSLKKRLHRPHFTYLCSRSKSCPSPRI